MIKIASHWLSGVIVLSVILLTLSFAACGGSEEAQEDVSTASTAGETSSADSPTADAGSGTSASASPVSTLAADAQVTSSVSVEEYIMTVCGEGVTEVDAWEEGDSLRELSEGLGFVSEQMSALEPPAEVSEWHDAQISFARAYKETIDDYLEDPSGRTEDEFLISMFLTVGSHFRPVEQAIAGMDADVRTRMAEAGCIDAETSEPTQSQFELEREEIPVGGSASGTLGETDGPANYQFQAEMGQAYLIEVSWEGITRVRLLIKDPPDPMVTSIDQSNSSTSPLLRRWTAPETGTFHIELYALEGTGPFNISVAIDDNPVSP